MTAEEETDNCSYIVYHDEIEKHFGVSPEWLRIHESEILFEIQQHSDIIADAQIGEEATGKTQTHYFDLDIYGNYCDVDLDED